MKVKLSFVFIACLLILSACSNSQTVTITYQTNGGNSISEVKINSDSPQWNPTIPVRDNYLFVNYCIDETLTTPYTPQALLDHKALTLFAQWLDADNDTHVIVSFVTSGGTYISNELISKGATIDEPISPSITNGTFSHWTYYDVSEGLDKVFDFSTQIDEHMTLFAQYN